MKVMHSSKTRRRVVAYVVLGAALLPPVGVAAQTPDTAQRTIAVTGQGSVERQPDRAVLMIAVETFEPTAQAASQGNATKMEALVRTLRQAGLTADKIRTTAYHLNPEYDFREGRKPGEERIVGYRAMNMVQVTIDSVPRVGPIIDAAVTSGANRIAGLHFQMRDPDAARRDALRAAVANAEAEASALADALGARLGPALRVSTGSPGPQPLMMEAIAVRQMDMAAAPTPIEPGALTVTAFVTIVYAIANR